MGDEVYVIEGAIKYVTDKAILVDDGDVEHWIPLSQLKQFGPKNKPVVAPEEIVEIEIPEWLAKKKGLL